MKLHDGKEFNFIKSTEETDKELFFGPLNKDDEFIGIQDNWIMADIMVQSGLFPSKSQARKNGWNKPIPSGFSMHTVGKYKVLITILNIDSELEEKLTT